MKAGFDGCFGVLLAVICVAVGIGVLVVAVGMIGAIVAASNGG